MIGHDVREGESGNVTSEARARGAEAGSCIGRRRARRSHTVHLGTSVGLRSQALPRNG